jgi:hypothetical protein
VFNYKNEIKKKFAIDWEEERDYNNILSRLYRRCKQKTHLKFESKGESIVEYKLGRITKC